MHVSIIVSLVSSRKVSEVIDQVLKIQRMTGRGTYETCANCVTRCYFWGTTPGRAALSVRQLPHDKFWIFEGRFPGDDSTVPLGIALLLSHLDGLSRILAMGEGRCLHFDHIDKRFKKQPPGHRTIP